MHITEYRKYTNYIKSKGNFKISKLMSLDRDEKLMSLTSCHTPCDIKLPRKIGIVFNWEDLEQYEECDLEILSIRLSGRTYYETKLGHTCELKVKYENWICLFDLSLNSGVSELSIGLCEKDDWELIKENLTRIRTERIEE